MSTQATEHAFETQVEAALGASGWQPAPNAEWDVERALFPARVCTFLEETQPKRWTEMRTLHGGGLERLLIAALVKELDVKGTLQVLRHGFKFYGKSFRLATFKAAHGLNDECTAPGFLDTHLRYAAWRSSYSSRASSGVRYASFSRRQHWL